MAREYNKNQMPMPQASAPEVGAEAPEVAAEEKAPEQKPAPVISKKIQVVATRHGIYKRCRKAPGDKFTIDSEKHLGTWMKKI